MDYNDKLNVDTKKCLHFFCYNKKEGDKYGKDI